MTTTLDFEKITTFEALVETSTQAIVNKSIFKWNITTDFDKFYNCLMALSDSENELRSLATLGRIEAALKKPVFNIEKIGALIVKPPEIQALQEGDDRYYAALVVARLSPDWIYAWALVNFWAETVAEKTRLVFAEILVDHADNLETMLADAGRTGQAFVKDQKLDEAKVCVRFLRIIKVLRTICQGRDVQCGIDVGKAIDAFISSPFSHFTIVQKKINVRKALIAEVVGLLLDLIAQRFSLAIESNHYAALKRIRQWCDDVIWREIVSHDPLLGKLRSSIAEAVLILARQDIADGELLKQLKITTESDFQFNEVCQKLARRTELDSAISEWLHSGGQARQIKRKISSDGELAKKGLSIGVGELLLRLGEGKEAIDRAENAIDDLELFDPSLTPVIKDLSNHWKIIQNIAGDIADRNGVALVGELGSQVEVDWKIYDATGGGDINRRFGIVVRSAVVLIDDGKTVVIKKGIVDIVED